MKFTALSVGFIAMAVAVAAQEKPASTGVLQNATRNMGAQPVRLNFMKLRLIRSVAAAVVLCAMVKAEEMSDAGRKIVRQDLAILQAAMKSRGDMAIAVGSGELDPELALAQLREEQHPGGTEGNRDASFAWAAIDVGHRLLRRNPAEAEPFFRAAEAALDQQVQRTPDALAKDKAQYLQHLAMIRGSYLNKAEQAQADIAAALKLQPEDKYLAQFQKTLTSRTSNPAQALVKKEGSK